MGRNADPLEKVAAGIRGDGGRAVAQAGDVTKLVDVEAAVARAVSEFGTLDLLVTCAGAGRDRLLQRMTEEDWDSVIDAHLKGTFFSAKAAQAVMVERGFGRMVFLSSAAVRGSRGQVNYSAAKAGVIAMARTLAIELGPSKITVNAVVPGFVDTDMTRAVAERIKTPWEELAKTMAERTSLGRIGTPDDVAGVIAFLCSDDAAFVTGQAIWIRGGP
jgi:3-oxoacyl-[acyl-carrier protein] reductase